MSSFCTGCGNPIGDRSKFCGRCGTPIPFGAPASTPVSAPAATPGSAPSTNPPTPNPYAAYPGAAPTPGLPPGTPPSPPGSRRTWLIAAGTLVAALVIGLGAWFVIGGSGNDSTDTATKPSDTRGQGSAGDTASASSGKLIRASNVGPDLLLAAEDIPHSAGTETRGFLTRDEGTCTTTAADDCPSPFISESQPIWMLNGETACSGRPARPIAVGAASIPLGSPTNQNVLLPRSIDQLVIVLESADDAKTWMPTADQPEAAFRQLFTLCGENRGTQIDRTQVDTVAQDPCDVGDACSVLRSSSPDDRGDAFVVRYANVVVFIYPMGPMSAYVIGQTIGETTLPQATTTTLPLPSLDLEPIASRAVERLRGNAAN